MKKKWTGIKLVMGICAALGWWGVLYPEFAMTPDTYVVTGTEEGKPSETQKWSFDSEIYWEILNADSDQISFKSRLFEELYDRSPQKK